MFCHKCGNKLPEGSDFCSKCGTKLLSGDDTTQATSVTNTKKDESHTHSATPSFAVGETVYAKWEDGSFYQCKILKVTGKVAKIKYIDDGIVSEVKLSNIKASHEVSETYEETNTNLSKKLFLIGIPIIGTIAFIWLLLVGISSLFNDTQVPETQTPETQTSSESQLFTFGSTFVYRDLEITIGSANRYRSQFWQSDWIRVQITMTNLRDSSHRFFSSNITVFDPNGIEVVVADSSAFDNNIWESGNMQSGATQTAFIYFQDRGDGEYLMEFSERLVQTVSISLPIGVHPTTQQPTPPTTNQGADVNVGTNYNLDLGFIWSLDMEDLAFNLGEPLLTGEDRGMMVWYYQDFSLRFDGAFTLTHIFTNNPSVLSVNGVTLNLNQIGLLATLGEPEWSDWITRGEVYGMNFFMGNYSIEFTMSSPDTVPDSVVVWRY